MYEEPSRLSSNTFICQTIGQWRICKKDICIKLQQENLEINAALKKQVDYRRKVVIALMISSNCGQIKIKVWTFGENKKRNWIWTEKEQAYTNREANFVCWT